MGKIQQLNEHLTNMIAAGEVVERPMGVVKELVENSIDAHASSIEIIVSQGGMQSIKVIDNGIGMDASDASMAFQRHATSKIKETNDLWAIQTMGFRGEALPSIASVSNVVLLTSDGMESTRIEVQYGKTIGAKPFSCPRGTQITVSGLFLKTPARLKHLKTINYETALITSIVEKFALSHPFIAFRFVAEDKVIFTSNGNGNLIEVLYSLYGKDTAKAALEVEYKDYDYTIQGILVLPSVNRANRNYIITFVNGRMIKSYRLQKVVLDSYREYLPDDRYPVVVIDIKMDAQLVDVNVHPSKWEIRLSKEQQLENLIRESIVASLHSSMKAHEVIIQPKPIISEKVEIQNFNFAYEPTEMLKVEEEPIFYSAIKEVVATDQLEENLTSMNDEQKKAFPQMLVIGQLHGKYILAQGDEGLYIIDQHAAQERYHFEQIQKKIMMPIEDYFDLLIPTMVDLPLSLTSRMNEIIEKFQELSIEIEFFGNSSILIRKVPIWMKDVDIKQFLLDMIDLFQDDKIISIDRMRKEAVSSMACHSSIRFNRVLSMDEMKQVILDLSTCSQPFQCPHGRPTFISISEKQLLKEFYR